jgi:hypothetical protein
VNIKLVEQAFKASGYTSLFDRLPEETASEWYGRASTEIYRRWGGCGMEYHHDIERLGKAVVSAEPSFAGELARIRRKAVIAAIDDSIPWPIKRQLESEGMLDSPAVQAVRRWSESESPRHLVLRGGVGVGKSVAAATWLLELATLRLDSFPGSAPFERGKMAWVRPDQLVSGVMHAYDKTARPPAFSFVLDDMGRETKPDFQEALTAILDGGDHTMIITTNLTKEQLRQRYDARLVDRMNEACIAFDVPGKSMRKQDGGF